MDHLKINSSDIALIGINKEHTVKCYYKRDNEMGINTNNQIIESMKKLGYYNIDSVMATKNYILNSVTKIIAKDMDAVRNNTVDNLISKVKNSMDYSIFITILNHKINRAVQLTKFISQNDTYDFYNTLTIDELSFLGY